MRKYLLFFSVFFLFSFSETSLKKRISDTDFRYEFYTTNKAVNPQPERQYFWFKGGAIHNSEYGLAGELLHSQFQKFYHSNQLAEAGKYNNGLKEGIWKSWFKNGILQSNVYWNEGQKDGNYYAYDETGLLVEKGRYKNDKKHGRWVNFISKDTLKYNDGKIVVKKPKKVKDTVQKNKSGFFKRIFGKKDSLQVNQRKADKLKKSSESKVKKESFFKRIFSKKQKTENTPAIEQQSMATVPQEKKGNFFKRLFSKKEKKPKNNG